MRKNKQRKLKHVSGFIVYGLLALSIGLSLFPVLVEAHNGSSLFALLLIVAGGISALYGSYYFLDKLEWAIEKYLSTPSQSAQFVEPEQGPQQ